MRPFRFVHAADLHLDSAFSGMKDVAPQVAERLREATFSAFDRIINICVEQKASFLLVAGDVYDSQDASLRSQLYFRDGVARLSKQNIATFVVHGNHDPLDRWSATLRWPEGAHVMGGENVERVPASINGETVAYVYGVSYLTRDTHENLSQAFTRDKTDAFAIGLLHCNVGTNTGHEPYAPCSIEDLTRVEMNYWALGHVHSHRILRAKSPTIVYAGNPQGRNPNELGPHGCYVVDVNEGGQATPHFVETDVVRWFSESLSIEGMDDDEALVTQLEGLCEDIVDRAQGRSAVCRITLEGSGPTHASLTREGFLSDLEGRLRDQYAKQSTFVWVERLEDTTRPTVDVATRIRGEDFVGELLRVIDGYRNQPERLALLGEELKPLYSSPRGRRLLTPPDTEKLKSLLDTAEDRLLDLLVDEEG